MWYNASGRTGSGSDRNDAEPVSEVPGGKGGVEAAGVGRNGGISANCGSSTREGCLRGGRGVGDVGGGRS